jgi:hypothetical protein
MIFIKFYIIIIFLILIFNKLFFFYRKNIIFFNYLRTFIYFSLILFLIALILFKSFPDIKKINSEELLLILYIYMLTFVSFLLTIGLKFIPSPSEEIFKIIKKNKISFKNLYFKIKKKKLIANRIYDLINQDLIYKKKSNYYLTRKGKIFAKIFFILKKLLSIKVEG